MFTPFRGAQQITLDEAAGDLPVRAKEDWDAEVDGDGERAAEQCVGMGAAAIAPGQYVCEIRLDNDTRA